MLAELGFELITPRLTARVATELSYRCSAPAREVVGSIHGRVKHKYLYIVVMAETSLVVGSDSNTADWLAGVRSNGAALLVTYPGHAVIFITETLLKAA